jgi:GTP-binding protein
MLVFVSAPRSFRGAGGRRIVHYTQAVKSNHTVPAYPAVRFLLSANHAPQFPADTGSEVAVAGRSNAGKSSAINALTQRRSLARTSKTPGQTQLINFFELKAEQRLVDLPGYGFAKVPAHVRAHWQELVGGYLETRNSLMGLLLIVDSRRGLNDDDRGLIGWATQRGRRVHVLLSKSDKLSRHEGQRVLAGVRDELPMQASAQLFSAVSKEGVEEGREALDALLGNKKPGGSGGRATG